MSTAPHPADRQTAASGHHAGSSALVKENADGLYTLCRGQKLIKARDYEHLLHANQLVAEAKRKAAETEANARAGYEQAVQQGFEAGMKQAREKQLELLINQSRVAAGFLAQFEAQFVNCVVHAVDKLIGEKPAETQIRKLCRQMLRQMGVREQVTVKVNPSQLASVQAAFAGDASLTTVTVVADVHLKADDFLLQTPTANYHGSLSTQLSQLRRLLLTTFRGQSATAEVADLVPPSWEEEWETSPEDLPESNSESAGSGKASEPPPADACLASVHGLGPKRKAALMQWFGSEGALLAASVEDIARVPGITEKLAQAIDTALSPCRGHS